MIYKLIKPLCIFKRINEFMIIIINVFSVLILYDMEVLYVMDNYIFFNIQNCCDTIITLITKFIIK